LVSSHFVNQNIKKCDNLAEYDTWREAVVYSSEHKVMRLVFLIALFLFNFSCLC
jgi:hypothetical protein